MESKSAVEDDAGDADETGLDADEIATIMTQSHCSRSKAVSALRKHGNIVDAILVEIFFLLSFRLLFTICQPSSSCFLGLCHIIGPHALSSAN